MRRLVWLYPARWRRRYADEFVALLDEVAPSPRVAFDVLRGALDARMHRHVEEVPMEQPMEAWPGGRAGLAVAAAALVAPIVFVVAVWLKYGLGNGSLFDPMEPFFTSRFGEVVVVFGPLLALGASAWTLARASVVRQDGQLVGVVRIRLSLIGLALMLVSVALLGLFALYFVAENV